MTIVKQIIREEWELLKQELTSRVKLLQDSIISNQLDCYVVATEANIWYLSAVSYHPEERPFFIIVAPGEKPIMVVPVMEEAHLRKTVLDCTIISYWEYPSPEGSNWYEVLDKVINKYKRIGVEPNIPTDMFMKIAAGKAVTIDLVGELRMTKSHYELEAIRKTASICDTAMASIMNSAYYGASVVESFALSKTIQNDLIRSRDFDPITTSLLTAVWPAPISAMPHSIPGLADKLTKGPNVAMSYFRINGYAAECERTFFLSDPDDEMKTCFSDMMEARNIALKTLKAGVPCSEVDTAAKNLLIKKGYKENLLHRTGHGIGMGNHEQPWLAEGSTDILAENMVVSIEPGIYIGQVGGYRHSDTVLVTKTGYELITKFPTDLAGLIVKSANRVAKLKGSLIRKALKL
jgi:Xaa-Pro dipeptidase